MKKINCFVLIASLFLCLAAGLRGQEADIPKELSGDQLYQEAVKLQEQHDYRKACAWFQEAARRKANFVEAYHQAGLCCIKLLDADKARMNLVTAKLLPGDENLKEQIRAELENLSDEIAREKQQQEEEKNKTVAKAQEAPVQPTPAAPSPVKKPEQKPAPVPAAKVAAGKPALGPAAGARTFTGRDGTLMVLIAAGEFFMGSPDEQGKEDEHPRHKVRLDAFYLDAHEVTVAQYRKFCSASDRQMPATPPKWGWQDDEPMVYVTWADAVAYARFYQKRLPTEAEWEYACRAGGTEQYSCGDDAAQLGECAWYNANAGGRTHPVGQKKPNAWGLYDLSGNAWEWCADRYSADYRPGSPVQNPDDRVMRGGSWVNGAGDCRCALRNKGNRWSTKSSGIGFRCARPAS